MTLGIGKLRVRKETAAKGRPPQEGPLEPLNFEDINPDHGTRA